MAIGLTGPAALAEGVHLINPPVEVEAIWKRSADEWLASETLPGHFVSMMTAEGEVRTAMFWISDPFVRAQFEARWCSPTRH